MELRRLRYFVRVATELHFGRAADQLGISQPPLSQQIRALEEELGVVLFERTSRRVMLTTAGQIFLGEARATLDQAEHAMNIARRAAIGEVGELRFGLSPSALFVPIVSEAITEFRAAAPDVHLDLFERSFSAQCEGVTSRTLDIGLVRGLKSPSVPETVAILPLVTDRIVVALPIAHRLAGERGPISVTELADEPMVHYPYDREGFQEDLRRLFQTVGLRPRISQEVREMSTLLGLVAAGAGISVLPAPLARLLTDTVCYREISDAAASSAMWLIHSADTPSPACRAFLKILERRRQADAADVEGTSPN